MKKTWGKKQRNLCGSAVRAARLKCRPAVSQDDLAGRLAGLGLSLDQPALSRIERGERYLMDFELVAIARALRVAPAVLLPRG